MADDTFDDLFNYDPGIEELLGGPDDETNSAAPPGGKADDLGIDEEIKITKKRAPAVKLDENRLLSQAGIPKLRKSADTKLRLKGKHHEFSDVARLLNFYQFWLDDLYPRAKFADGLAIIEKLGHSKRLQVMRKEWIDEGKPRRARSHNAARTSNNQVNGTKKNDAALDPSVSSAVHEAVLTQKSPEAENGVGDDGASRGPEASSIFGSRRISNSIHNSDDNAFARHGSANGKT
ncbi:predicted protein [Uncinocarpus reesii 1704]|uniref:Chromosome segregation in meiosis protein n=1 Tax=Uncinocarpus reesii (strain UAMH 1704) TaxID=336963 RepID=C4JGR8_UNCRE|nr:uncharacterized protein UREG_02580 [Uncinocarpus reesii 1704]EEP77731.1 predicted protein [Uncinocarpus reesii 1704]